MATGQVDGNRQTMALHHATTASGKGPDLGPVVKVASDAFPGPIEKLKRSIGLVTLRGVLAEADGDYLALRHNMRYWRLSTLSPAPLRGLE